jgi:hypothetical protein
LRRAVATSTDGIHVYILRDQSEPMPFAVDAGAYHFQLSMFIHVADRDIVGDNAALRELRDAPQETLWSEPFEVTIPAHPTLLNCRR